MPIVIILLIYDEFERVDHKKIRTTNCIMKRREMICSKKYLEIIRLEINRQKIY